MNISSSATDELLRNAIYVIIFSLLLYFVYWYAYGRLQLFKKLGIPGPTPTLFVGNTYEILRNHRDRFHLYVHENLSKYGGMFGMFTYGVPTYVITDRALLKEVLVKQFDKFSDRQHSQTRPYPLNLMLGQLMGDHWKFVRSKLSPSFTTAKLRLLNTLFNEATDTAIKIIEKERHHSVDMAKIFQGFSMEAIVSSSFGIKTESHTPLNTKMLSLVQEFFLDAPAWHRLMNLLPMGNFLQRNVPCRFYSVLTELFALTKPVLVKRKSTENKQQDLLQLMIDSQTANNKIGLSDDEIFASCCIFLAAGFETSSATLSNLMFELAKHPEYQEKLFEEINTIWKDKSVAPSYEDVQKTKYMDVLIDECLRMYPPGSLIARACKEDCTINGVKFFAGSNVMVPIYTLHRDPAVWEKPNEFYPDHFSDEAKKTRRDTDYMPFGYGPRNCIGMRFAVMEIKIILTRLIGKYKFSMANDTPDELKLTMVITNIARHPIPLKVEER